MKILVTCASLLALAVAAPMIPPYEDHYSRVALRLIGLKNENTHYAPSGQQPTAWQGNKVEIIVGQVLSFDASPLSLQAIKIEGIQGGIEEGPKTHQVAQDDKKVFCKASLGFTSEGPVVSIDNGKMALDNGRESKVTRLECAYGKESFV